MSELTMQQKAEKWDNLMIHNKYHNVFGCGYHYDLIGEQRRNQFLQSKNQELMTFLDKRINDLDKRLSHWTNCTPMGNSAYNMLMRELETCREIKELMSNDRPILTEVKQQ